MAVKFAGWLQLSMFLLHTTEAWHKHDLIKLLQATWKKIQHIDSVWPQVTFLMQKKATGLKLVAIIGIVPHVIHGLKKEKMQQTKQFGAIPRFLLWNSIYMYTHVYTCIIDIYTYPHSFASLFALENLICS